MKLSPSLENSKRWLLDLVFPRYCLDCNKEISSKQPSLICDGCFGKIRLNSGIQCHICGLRNQQGTCPKCREKTPLKGLFAACQYQDPILKEMIHLFKYQSIESLKNPLTELMINYLKKENLIGRFDGFILAPIPLTLKRKLSRGFNQSELLAKELGEFLNCPVINLLKRKKFGEPQAEIPDWQQRKENIAGAFCLSTSYPQFYGCRKPIKVTLVDDVSTSAATLEEAAMVLTQAGIKEIYGLVVAKG